MSVNAVLPRQSIVEKENTLRSFVLNRLEGTGMDLEGQERRSSYNFNYLTRIRRTWASVFLVWVEKRLVHLRNFIERDVARSGYGLSVWIKGEGTVKSYMPT